MQLTQASSSSENSNKYPSSKIPLRASLPFSEKISNFFYYINGDRSYIIGQSQDKIIVFNTITQNKEIINVGDGDYVLEQQIPPYLFCIFKQRWIHAYPLGELGVSDPLKIRISKLQPKTIARFNKGFYIGGFNRSPLPGNKRSQTRSIYYINELKPSIKNKPDDQIFLKNNDNPVSYIQVQNPYIFVYCHPFAYLISITSKKILITFQKEAMTLRLLQGRYARSCVNGIGISSKNCVFSFDIERHPLFGIEMNQHKVLSECLSMDRTGRIFGIRGHQVFQYNPNTMQCDIIISYPQGQYVTWITCTTSNNLMVSRTVNNKTIINVFSIE